MMGWHLFARGAHGYQGVRDAREAWIDLPKAEQEPYCKDAADIRSLAARRPRATEQVLEHMNRTLSAGGPWNLSARRGVFPAEWPLHPDRVSPKTTLEKVHSSWVKERNLVP